MSAETPMSTQTPMQRIVAAVTAWPGVEAGPGQRGEFSFRVDGREIGHLHGDRAAHFSFPENVGTELRQAGLVGPHPVAPESMKLAARRITTDEDVEDVIELMLLNYERLVARRPGRAIVGGNAAAPSRWVPPGSAPSTASWSWSSE